MGTFPSRALGTHGWGSGLRKKLKDTFAIHDTPGAYSNTLSERGRIALPNTVSGMPEPEVNPTSKLSLIPLLLQRICEELIPRYLADDGYAKHVDTQKPSHVKKDPTKKLDALQGDRRFASNDGQRKGIQVWLEKMDELYLQRVKVIKAADPKDPRLSQPMSRCFFEAGWAQVTMDRVKGHLTHLSTTIIWSLVNAIVFAEEMGELYSVRQWHPLKVCTKEQAQPSELSLTMITSAYNYMGGWNYHPAGGMDVSNLDDEDRRLFLDRNKKFFYREGFDRTTNMAHSDAMLDIVEEF